MEFAIARFLIYARLSGQNVNLEKVPDSLIQSILGA
jgi:phosphotransferase system IIA component